MVVLTIVTQKNGETVYFVQPLPKVRFIKLLSCSLYNSWETLKNEGSAALQDRKLNPSRGCLVAFSLPSPRTRTFAPLTRRLSFPILPLGTRLRSRGISRHPQSSAGPGRVHPGAITADGLAPLPLTRSCAYRVRNQGRPLPTSKGISNHSLYVILALRGIYFELARGF